MDTIWYKWIQIYICKYAFRSLKCPTEIILSIRIYIQVYYLAEMQFIKTEEIIKHNIVYDIVLNKVENLYKRIISFFLAGW